jgi:predicted amidohydrolase
MPLKIKSLLYDEERAEKRIKAAITAMRCDRDVDNNRTRMVTTINTIMQDDPEVELVVFGEMILGWYIPGSDPEYHQKISESIPGATTQTLSTLALKYNIYICFGLSEVDGKAIHNSQVLINPQGEIQAVHRKVNLKQGEKDANYQPGQLMVTETEIKGVKTAIVICSDTANLDTIWELMCSKFELIIHSLADDDQDDFVTRLQARIYDSWVVTANRFGKEVDNFWPGLITVTDPLGGIRDTSIGKEQTLVYVLNFAPSGSMLKRVIRNIWVKTTAFFLLLKNWKQARTYH